MLCGSGGLGHFAHEACADEGIEAGITLALARLGVDGCVGFGSTELLLETGLPHLQRGEVFGGGKGTIMCGGIGFGLGGEKDALGLGRGSLETVLTLQFLAGGGIAFPVARMADGVRFGSGLVDDATFVVAVLLAAVDDAAFLERAAYVADRIEIVDRCHKCSAFAEQTAFGC